MKKRTWSKKRIIFETLGWVGTLTVLVAYFLVSKGVLGVGVKFHTMNAVGALCIFFASWHKRLFPVVVLNIVWGTIAIVAIYKLLT